MNDEQYHCPFCWASDRERLAALYIGKFFPTIMTFMTSNLSGYSTYKILHFAPARPLSRFIMTSNLRLLAQSGGSSRDSMSFSYRTADLFMEGVDDKVDITDMTIYGANQFDFFICSHILEHVADDKKAMAELHRILKPGGRGILMVPILLTIDEIDEDPSVTDMAERWRRFGQHDHLRVHSKKGFIERVEQAGFLIHQLGKDFFGEECFVRSGITSQSVLYVVEKPAN